MNQNFSGSIITLDIIIIVIIRVTVCKNSTGQAEMFISRKLKKLR